jgi:hypothetical protein
MSPLNQIGGLFAHLFGQGGPKSPALVPDLLAGPFETQNDAETHGVTVQPASVSAGQWYWQAVRVHHLAPDENSGSYHLYVNLVQRMPGGSEGGVIEQRVEGARAKISWQGGEEIVALGKEAGERGASFAMLQKRVYAVEALGLPGGELSQETAPYTSDRVTGLHTALPDEPPGNSLFHHSFSVTFCAAQAQSVAAEESVIQGLIRGATGETVMLLRNDEVVGRQLLGDDEAFCFAGLGGDVYVIALESMPLRSGPITVTGSNQARLELSVKPGGSTVTGHVSGGAGRTLILEADGAQVASLVVGADQMYRFSGLAAGAYQLGVAGTPVYSDLLTLDGTKTLTTDLAAPALDKPLAHYVLFGPAAAPGTHVNLLLARHFLLAFGPAFGFSAEEAAAGGVVTIVADQAEVSQAVQDGLAAGGSVVQRITGTAAQVAAALAERVAAGRPLA